MNLLEVNGMAISPRQYYIVSNSLVRRSFKWTPEAEAALMRWVITGRCREESENQSQEHATG